MRRFEHVVQREEFDHNDVNRAFERAETVLDRELPLISVTFYQDNIAASQTDVVLPHNAGTNTSVIILRKCYVRKIGVYTNDPGTAGTLTVTPRINGTKLTGGAELSSTTDWTKNIMEYDKIEEAFAEEEDILDCVITTDGSWLPTTADINVEVLLEATGE